MLRKFKKKGGEQNKVSAAGTSDDVHGGGSARGSSSGSKGKPKSGGKKKSKKDGSNRDVAIDARFLMGRLYNLGLMTQDGRKLEPQYAHAPWKVGRKYKMGMLTKQGGVIKSWHERCFVLREKGLFYFESAAAYKRDALPYGQIFMHDIVCPTGDDPVSEVALHLARHIRRPHAFCIHTAVRTYVFAAESEPDKRSWMNAIRQAYRAWQDLHRNDTIDMTTESSTTDDFEDPVVDQEVANPKKPLPPIDSEKFKSTMDNMGIPTVGSKRVAKHYLALLEYDFESEVQELRKRYELQRLWAHWVVYTKISKREKRERRLSTVEML